MLKTTDVRCALLALVGAFCFTAHAEQQRIDLPAGTVLTALERLAEQVDVDIVYQREGLEGLQTAGVSGNLTPRDAVMKLIQGTPLKLRVDEVSGALLITMPAADVQPTASSSTGEGVDVEEIVVTAQKRAERMIDVPASVSAVTGDMLQGIGATRLQDYAAQIPGFVVSDVSFSNGSNQLTIRGLTSGYFGNPTVGVYIDNSPFGASNGFGASSVPDLDPMDLARVEVLRGPQGTLYGAGSLGGLLKYVTSAPYFSEFRGRVEADGWQVDGGGAGYGARAAVNIPLNEKFALRVSGHGRQDPGYIDDAVTGADNVNEGHSDGGRASLAWRIDDNWTARVSALVQTQSATGSASVDYNPFTQLPQYGDLLQVRVPGTGRSRQEIGAYDLNIDGELGWATFSSSTSYNRQSSNFNVDLTTFYGPLLDQGGIPNAGADLLSFTHLDKVTQEFRLTSDDTARLSWLAGAFYTNERASGDQKIPAIDATTGAPLDLPILLDGALDSRFEEAAVFGDLTYRFTSRFDTTVGVRYSSNTQSQTQRTSGFIGGPAATIDASSADHSVTYLVTPSWHFSDHSMAYLRVASGYRPGGPNAALGGAPQSYEPDEVINYEAGLKTQVLDRRLTVEVAAYYIDWTNMQLPSRTESGISYVANAGRATSKGVEASAAWRPIAGLEISANVNHTIAQLEQDLPRGGAVGRAGDDLPFTPRWSGALNSDYSLPLWGDWMGLAGASYRHIGESQGTFSTFAGLPRFTLPSYDVVDLRLGAKSSDWTVMLYAKNVGDSRGAIADNFFGQVTRVSVIQSRAFGLSIAKSF